MSCPEVLYKGAVTNEYPDCGMTHFHDDDIKKALLELAPGEADSIGQSKYGEITGSYVLFPSTRLLSDDTDTDTS